MKTFLSGMSSGDYQSLVRFINCRQYHDGGNLEELYVEAGMFLERDPYLYEYILTKEDVFVSADYLKFFEMIPPVFVDDYEGQVNEYRKRQKLLGVFQHEYYRVQIHQALEEGINLAEYAKKAL